MSVNKKIKLDLNLNQIENIIQFNYDKQNYENIINLYGDIKYEKLTDNIYFILCLSFLKLEKYENSINILLLNEFAMSYDIINIFFGFFNISPFINKKDIEYNIIKNYILGDCYKKLKDIKKSEKYFKICKDIAQEKILIFFVKNIDNQLIELYELDKNNYIYDLINLYKSNDSYRKVIELYEEKNMTKELNDYIRNIIQDEYMFMFDDDNIEYYLDKYVISEESDIIFLLEKYVNLGKLNEIQKLLNISIEQNLSDIIQIKILYELIKLNHKRIKYCERVFELFEKNNYDNTELQNILKNIVEYYNNELKYSHRLGNKKYEKYLTKDNLDRINNNYAVYLNLYKYFDINNIKKDKCVICLKENIEIITLKCHHTHNCCYRCYPHIDKCPLCRDKIYK